MRIKEDFITNSSSTSFVLKAICIGQIDYVDIDLSKNLKKKFKLKKDEFNKWLTDKRSFSFCKDLSNTLWTGKGNEDDDDSNNGMIFLEIESFNLGYIDKNGKEIDDWRTLLKIEAMTPLIWNKDEGKLLNLVIGNLKKVLSIYKEDIFVDLFYSQHVHEVCGDGWDDGDPMGEYEFTKDVYEQETKLGRIRGNKNFLRFDR
jgi:hypothetical protein